MGNTLKTLALLTEVFLLKTHCTEPAPHQEAWAHKLQAWANATDCSMLANYPTWAAGPMQRVSEQSRVFCLTDESRPYRQKTACAVQGKHTGRTSAIRQPQLKRPTLGLRSLICLRRLALLGRCQCHPSHSRQSMHQRHQSHAHCPCIGSTCERTRLRDDGPP